MTGKQIFEAERAAKPEFIEMVVEAIQKMSGPEAFKLALDVFEWRYSMIAVDQIDGHSLMAYRCLVGVKKELERKSE